jgi:hypothetical protein
VVGGAEGHWGFFFFLISNTVPHADALRRKHNSERRGSSMAGGKVFPSEKTSVRPSVYWENY